MGCQTYGDVIICSTSQHLRRAVGCPVCEIADAPIVIAESASPWFGPDFACAVCGDRWADGELMERPFRRGWRQESIADAEKDWEAACECPVDRDDDLYIIPCVHERVPS